MRALCYVFEVCREEDHASAGLLGRAAYWGDKSP